MKRIKIVLSLFFKGATQSLAELPQDLSKNYKGLIKPDREAGKFRIRGNARGEEMTREPYPGGM